ncbi:MULTISPECIES: NUDIX domain-containing protein [unclassified Ornithinimicrobium]|uniref:NUDIX domain-containing protein n=1 Tax=unclassified Ornithinimicrobium TaxID=2615080 RepID=UPI0038535E4D
MSLSAPTLSLQDLVDAPGARRVSGSETAFHGAVWDVRRDTVHLEDGPVAREYMAHPGAIAVLAVREDRGEPEVLMIRQYRHPVAAEDWEIPAGLLDVEGEPPLEAAQRELAEEADLVADRWELLFPITTSPGGSAEVITIFVATGLSEVDAGDRHEREHEEIGMPVGWVPLSTAVAAVLGAQVRNAPMMLAVLALDARLRG